MTDRISSVTQPAPGSGMPLPSPPPLPTVQESNTEFLFELRPKPKVTCIPKRWDANTAGEQLRKTQSLSTAANSIASSTRPEKTWSVLFVGARYNINTKSFIA